MRSAALDDLLLVNHPHGVLEGRAHVPRLQLRVRVDDLVDGIRCWVDRTWLSLDIGAIGFADDLRLMVSAELHGQNWFEEWFLTFAGEPLRAPQDPADRPDPAFLDWHRREVFRAPSRVR